MQENLNLNLRNISLKIEVIFRTNFLTDETLSMETIIKMSWFPRK